MIVIRADTRAAFVPCKRTIFQKFDEHLLTDLSSQSLQKASMYSLGGRKFTVGAEAVLLQPS